MSQPSISLFYPMYNEVKTVESMTRKALEVLPAISDDYEILIIDDGSSDGSEKLADELAQSDPHVKVIHHNGNQGYGQALRTGWAAASKDIVAYTDCDEPVDLWRFRDAVAEMTTHDLVIGYRVNRWDGYRRFAYSLVYNTLIRVLFGVNVRDVNFSFKLIWRDKLRKLHLGAGSVFIDGEFLSEAARNHFTIAQMPVEYMKRVHGVSNFDSVRAATYTFEEIFAYWQRRRSEKSAVRSTATL